VLVTVFSALTDGSQRLISCEPPHAALLALAGSAQLMPKHA